MSDQIPSEVWQQIYTHLRASGDDHWEDLKKAGYYMPQCRSTLLPLLLTCQSFQAIAEPLLYEHVVVYLPPAGSPSWTIVEALQVKEDRRLWVKTLVATWRPSGRDDRTVETCCELSKLVEMAIDLTPNLQGLRLFRIRVSERIYRWSLNHSSLRTLMIQRCDFVEGHVYPLDLQHSSITNLTLTQTSRLLQYPLSEACCMVMLPGLAETTVAVTFFEKITTILERFPIPQLPGLRRLTIRQLIRGPPVEQLRRVGPLRTFLVHCPGLTHLQITDRATCMSSGIPMPSMKNLKALRGPPEVVAALCHDAEDLNALAVNGMIDQNSLPFTGVGGRIRTLSMDIGIDGVAFIVPECLLLESLALRLRPENHTNALKTMDHAVSVADLSLILAPELSLYKYATIRAVMKSNSQVEGEGEVVAELNETLPELNVVALTSEQRWRRFPDTQTWEIVIPLSNHRVQFSSLL